MKFVYFKTSIFCDSHPLITNKMYTTYIYLQPPSQPSIQKVMSRKKRLNMMSQMRMSVLKTRWRTGVTSTSQVICYLEQRIWLIRHCKRIAEWQLKPMIMRHPLTIKRQMGRIHYWKRTRQKIGQRRLREVMYFSCRKDLLVPAYNYHHHHHRHYYHTRNTCIADTRKARGGGRPIKCQGWRGERSGVSCVA